jgi:hypothetical protein
MEALEQARLHQALDDRFGAGHVHDTRHVVPGRGDGVLEGGHHALDAFGVGQHRLAKLSQPIPRGMALDQRLPEPPLELRQASLDRGLIDPEGPTAGQRAAVPRHRQEVLQVVPIEHDGASLAVAMQTRGPLPAILRLTPGGGDI